MHVALFFTRGLSLNSWMSTGMFSREVRLYKSLVNSGVKVTFVTYGSSEELEYKSKLEGIHVCYNKWGLSPGNYAKFISLLHWFRLRKVDLIKSNQMNGAEVALQAAKLHKKPFIGRCGYMWSKNAGIETGHDSEFTNHVKRIEATVFSSADRVVVTTNEMKDSVSERFPETAGRVKIIPNYVDTDLFVPGLSFLGRQRLCFIGRLAPEKNLEALIDAVAGMDVDVDIIGDGPLKQSLMQQAAKMDNIHFIGSVPNDSLPAYLQRAALFVFPSLYEGHPKTPIEAMACGVPVVACNVSGVKELIEHGHSGWLCNTDAVSIREGIERLLTDNELRKRVGESARKIAVESYSLQHVLKEEIKLYQSILNENNS